MKNLIILTLLLLGSSLLGQISAIDLYTASERTDQRSYGNGAIAMLINGDNLVRQGRWEDAIMVYDNVVEMWPNWAPAYLKRAMTKARMGRSTEAERDLQRAYLISPNSVALFSLNNPANRMKLMAIPAHHALDAHEANAVNDLKIRGQLFQIDLLIDELENQQLMPLTEIALLRGNLRLLHEDHFQAIAYYDWAIDRNKSPELLHNRGLARILTYNFPDGCADLEEAGNLGYQPSKNQHLDLCSF
jgi:tetratricopeptide (TPR) repeat protein